MVKDGRECEVVKDLRALLAGQNKGLKSLADHGVETPTVLVEIPKSALQNHALRFEGTEAWRITTTPRRQSRQIR